MVGQDAGRGCTKSEASRRRESRSDVHWAVGFPYLTAQGFPPSSSVFFFFPTLCLPTTVTALDRLAISWPRRSTARHLVTYLGNLGPVAEPPDRQAVCGVLWGKPTLGKVAC